MKMTLLPPRIERALKNFIERSAFKYMLRNSKVGKEAGNGVWMGGSHEENLAAYEAMRRDVWMYSSIYAIASAAAGLPFGEYKRQVSTKGGEYVLNEDGNATNLFEKPNKFQTKSEFMEAIFFSLELTGKVFIECVPNKATAQEMFVLDPRNTTAVGSSKDPSVYVDHYEVKVGGDTVKLPADAVIFHRYHNPNDDRDGLSASTPAGDAINSNILSSQYNNEYFGNSAIPAAVLEVERKMSDQECESLRMQWEKGYKGRKKRHRTAILWGGVKFNVIQKSPKDMEFVKQKTLNREETLAAYGVPPVMVGLLESVNYANSKEQRKLFWQQTMRAKLKSFSERMTIEFGLDGFKRKCAFDLTDVEALQEDQEIRSRIAFNLTKGLIMVPDEIRRILYKMPALPDGVGADLWIPSNMVPAKLLMNGPIAAPTAPGKPGKTPGPDQQPGPENTEPGGNASKPAGKEPAAKTINVDNVTERDIIEVLEMIQNDSIGAAANVSEVNPQILV